MQRRDSRYDSNPSGGIAIALLRCQVVPSESNRQVTRLAQLPMQGDIPQPELRCFEASTDAHLAAE